jgi:hypothetical protein
MLTKTPESQAAEYANGVLNAINQTLTRSQALIANGATANPQIGAPAVTAASITTALGPVNSAVIQLMVAAAATTDPEKLQAATADLA